MFHKHLLSAKHQGWGGKRPNLYSLEASRLVEKMFLQGQHTRHGGCTVLTTLPSDHTWILSSPLPGCVTLGKLLNLSVIPSLHLSNEDHNSIDLTGFWGLNEMRFLKHLEQNLTHNKFHIKWLLNKWRIDYSEGFPGGSEGKESSRSSGDTGSIPRLGGSPGEGNGNPFQYSCLENPIDRGA